MLYLPGWLLGRARRSSSGNGSSGGGGFESSEAGAAAPSAEVCWMRSQSQSADGG